MRSFLFNIFLKIACFVLMLYCYSNNSQNLQFHIKLKIIAADSARSNFNKSFFDPNSKAFYTWENDDNCKEFSVRFAKPNTFLPRALVSFPGSGNSWVRYLLEGSTGIFTGSMYNDKRLYKLGYWGEFQNASDGTTIVQKTHFVYRQYFGYRGILVIRNSYDAFRSYWNFWNTRDHTGHAEELSEKKFNAKVTEWTDKWFELIKKWVENSSDLIILLYEEIKANPDKEIIRILRYLSLPVDENRLKCTLSHIEGPARRPSKGNQIELLRFSDERDSDIRKKINLLNVLFSENQINLYLNYTDQLQGL